MVILLVRTQKRRRSSKKAPIGVDCSGSDKVQRRYGAVRPAKRRQQRPARPVLENRLTASDMIQEQISEGSKGPTHFEVVDPFMLV